VFAAALVLAAGSAAVSLPASARPQVDAGSADWVMRGCRTYLAGKTLGFEEGVCAGMVRGVLVLAPEVCSPPVTMGQAVRVVAAYIEARPARHHESFTVLTLEALRSAWPCPR